MGLLAKIYAALIFLIPSTVISAEWPPKGTVQPVKLDCEDSAFNFNEQDAYRKEAERTGREWAKKALVPVVISQQCREELRISAIQLKSIMLGSILKSGCDSNSWLYSAFEKQDVSFFRKFMELPTIITSSNHGDADKFCASPSYSVIRQCISDYTKCPGFLQN